MATLTLTIDTDRLARSGSSLAETLAHFASDYGKGGAKVVWTPQAYNVGTAQWERTDEVQEHIEKVCKEAGFGVMVQVYEIVRDREEVSESALLALTTEDVDSDYESFVGNAVDDIERRLLDED